MFPTAEPYVFHKRNLQFGAGKHKDSVQKT